MTGLPSHVFRCDGLAHKTEVMTAGETVSAGRSGAVRYSVLGPFRVEAAGHAVELSGKQQAVLGALLLDANTVVRVDRLVGAVWDRPPASATANLQTYVSGLRRALERLVPGTGARLHTEPGGYRIEVERGEFDLIDFDHLHRSGQAALCAGRLAAAAAALERALRLWRGEPLEQVPLSTRVQPDLAALAERQADARSAWIDARLALGQHHVLIGELRRLVRVEPLSEQRWGQLMLALHRAGRRTAALAAYAQARALLVAELGVEPSAHLVRLHTAILAGEPEFDAPGAPGRSDARGAAPGGAGGAVAGAVAGGVAGAAAGAVPGGAAGAAPGRAARAVPGGVAGAAAGAGPGGAAGAVADAVDPRAAAGAGWPAIGCRLPAEVADFVGRADAVDRLVAALTAGPAPRVVTVSGPPGIGTTALACRVAHRLRRAFPDGQVHVPLGGRGGGRDVAGVLGELLRMLGMAADAVPAGLGERVGSYRCLLADRRVLLWLDGAADEAQVELLLPGTDAAGVIVSGRSRLTGLPAADRIDLEPLPEADAVVLLDRIVAAGRVAAEPAAARAVVGWCDRVPLAVRVAGARLAARPAWPLADFAARLADEGRRLDELSFGGRSVRTTLRTGLAALPPLPRRALRLLSQVRAAPISSAAVAALLDLPEPDADHIVEALVVANLLRPCGLDPAGQPAYLLPDLLRLCAAEQPHPTQAT
jgi:DNA-binding SARP family transcriptional activator